MQAIDAQGVGLADGGLKGALVMGAVATVALSACGAGAAGFEQMTSERAARLLNQGGLGSTQAEVDAIVAQGADAWFDAQVAMPPGASIWQWAIDHGYANRAFARSDYGLDQAMWWRLCTAQDVLRQRMVLALSEIFVVSPLNMVAYWRQFGCIAWWELLERHCFGNFRDLLTHVTLSPGARVEIPWRRDFNALVYVLAGAGTVDRRDGMGLAQAQPPELRRHRQACLGRLALVHRQQHRHVVAAQPGGDRLIGRRAALLAVHDHQGHRGLSQGQVGLLADLRQEFAVVVEHQAAGVDDAELPIPPVALLIGAVAGDPRLIVHDRLPAAAQTVDEGGLAHIGAAEDGDNR